MISSIILAGGQSRRLGVNKALVPVGGVPLIERELAVLRLLSADLHLIANDSEPYRHLGLPITADAWPDAGSLGGLYTGLRIARHPHVLAVGCDMPFLSLPLLRYMAGLAADYDVIIPRTGKLIEPLHAIYSRACLAPMEDLLRRGGRRIIAFFPHVRVRYVEQAEIEIYDPERRSFFNINTPEDLATAERLLSPS